MERKIQLDGLRGIAILMVFIYHAFNVPLLWSGVDLFFVLSGYLITGILLRMKDQRVATSFALRSFYSRRACRILPAYLLFLFIATLVFQVHWSHLWYWYAFFGANVASALTSAVGKVKVLVLDPLWSLAVEEQFYFVWPLVVLLSRDKTLKRLALGLIVVAPIMRVICAPFVSSAYIYYLTPFRMDTLAWGAAIAIFEREDPACIRSRHRLASVCAIAAGIVLCALSPLHSFHRTTGNGIFFNILGFSLIGLVFAGTVFHALGSQEGFAHAILTLRPLRYMGQISYTFYLYHFGVLMLIRQYFHSTIFCSALNFGITGAIAAVSWAFYESPILRGRLSVRVNGLKASTTRLVRAK